MVEAGVCKCGNELNLMHDADYDHENFEGDIICQQCQRCYHWEMKRGVVKLGRCYRIFRENLPPTPVPYILGQGVVGYKMS